jgi:hypothetical protein
MVRALALVAVLGCSASQARTAHRAGEVIAGGGLVAMLGALTAAVLIPGPNTTLLEGGAVLVPVVIVGAGMYVATDGTVNAPPSEQPTARTRTWNAAMDLAKQAKHAARAGDCAEVQAIEPRVRDLDSDVYLRFTRDQVIRTCLGPAAEP